MVNVAILGHGVVGSGVAEILLEKEAMIASSIGRRVRLKKILDLRAFESLSYQKLFTTDIEEILQDKSIKIIIECMGGTVPAADFARRALEAGKHFVTSNKELVAAKGGELMPLARKMGVHFLYEASVGGGIPLIHPLKNCLRANRVLRLEGILNGTTNYILTRMAKSGASYPVALAEAQRLGYAEKNPSADVDGYDARRKIGILAHVCFGGELSDNEKIPCTGISKVTAEDIRLAGEVGCAVKLIAAAWRVQDAWTGRVAPSLVPDRSALFAVEDVFNAVLARGDSVGDVMLYGRGAGKHPTASAVVSDVIEAAASPRKLPYEASPDEATAFEQNPQQVEKCFVRVQMTPGAKEKVAGIIPQATIVTSADVADAFAIVTPEGDARMLGALLQKLEASGLVLGQRMPVLE